MKITVYLAASANGMISNQRNVPDWLSDEYSAGFMEQTQKAKAVIMGKTTYNILAPDYLPLKDEGALVVLTRDAVARPAQSNVIFTDKNPKSIVAMLEAQGYSQAVIIGGTETVSAFMNDGLVDEIVLVIEPVLFGSGLPLLRGVDQEYKMSLLDVRKLNEHTVQLKYKIV
ncbi:MAG TPA: dihydrofolate reductase family protein [Chryseolinea sp.]